MNWTEFDRGHFAAMEEPDLFVGDLRAFARTLVGAGEQVEQVGQPGTRS